MGNKDFSKLLYDPGGLRPSWPGRANTHRHRGGRIDVLDRCEVIVSRRLKRLVKESKVS